MLRQRRHHDQHQQARGWRRAALPAALAAALVVAGSLLSAARPAPAEANVVDDVTGWVWDQTGGRLVDAAGGMVGDWAVEAMAAILNMLFGGLQAKLTTAVFSGLVELPDFTGGNVGQLANTTQAVAFGLLTAVLTITGLRFFFMGMASGGGGFEPAQAFLRVVGACAAVVVWPTVFSTLIELESALVDALWSSPSVQDDLSDLWSVFNVAFVATGSFGIGWFLGIIVAIATMVLIVGLILLKIVLTASTVFLFVGMPLAFILWPIPELAWIARYAMRALTTMLLMPVLWTLLFAATAAIGVDTLTFTGGGDLIDKALVKPLVGVALLYTAFVLPKHLLRMAALGAPTPGGGFASRTASYTVGRQLVQAAQPYIPQWAGGSRGLPSAMPMQRSATSAGTTATATQTAGSGGAASGMAGAAGAATGGVGAAAAAVAATEAATRTGATTTAGTPAGATPGTQAAPASTSAARTPTAADQATSPAVAAPAAGGQSAAAPPAVAAGATRGQQARTASGHDGPAQIDFIPRDRNTGLLPVAGNEQARQREMDALAAHPQPQHTAEQAMAALTPRMRQEVAAKAAEAPSQRAFAAEMAHQSTGHSYSRMEAAAFRSLMRHDRADVIQAAETLGNQPAGVLDLNAQLDGLTAPSSNEPRTDVPLAPAVPAAPGLDSDGGQSVASADPSRRTSQSGIALPPPPPAPPAGAPPAGAPSPSAAPQPAGGAPVASSEPLMSAPSGSAPAGGAPVASSEPLMSAPSGSAPAGGSPRAASPEVPPPPPAAGRSPTATPTPPAGQSPTATPTPPAGQSPTAAPTPPDRPMPRRQR